MDSFSALKNNSFGDFNKEDVLGFIDKMTHRAKKAELILRDRVDVLNREREHLSAKISSFEKVISGLEQHLLDEKENVRKAIMERDELRKEISVERVHFDSIIARKQKELADSEREILQFAKEREELNARLSELETKSRRYDDIKASVKAIRLEAEMEAMKTKEETQGQVMEAVHIIDGIAEEVENMRKQFDPSRRDTAESESPVLQTEESSEPKPADSPSSPLNTEKAPAESETAAPESASVSESATDVSQSASSEPVLETKSGEPISENQADDPLSRLNALYKALDESMERLQEIRTQFFQNEGIPGDHKE